MGLDLNAVHGFFDEMMAVGVKGMMTRPGDASDQAIGQSGFRHHERAKEHFNLIRSNHKNGWRFNQSPFFLAFPKSGRDFKRSLWTDGAPRPVGRRHGCQA